MRERLQNAGMKKNNYIHDLDTERSKALVIKALDTILVQSGLQNDRKGYQELVAKVLDGEYQTKWKNWNYTHIPRSFDKAMRLSMFVGVRYTSIYSFDAHNIAIKEPEKIQARLRSTFSTKDKLVFRKADDRQKITVSIPCLAFKMDRRGVSIAKGESARIKEAESNQRRLGQLTGDNRTMTDVLCSKYDIKDKKELDERIAALQTWINELLRHKFANYIAYLKDSLGAAYTAEFPGDKGDHILMTSVRQTDSDYSPSIELWNTLEYIFDIKYEKFYPTHTLLSAETNIVVPPSADKTAARVNSDKNLRIIYNADRNLYYFEDKPAKGYNFIGANDKDGKYLFCLASGDVIEKADSLREVMNVLELEMAPPGLETTRYLNNIVVIDMKKYYEQAIKEGRVTIYDREIYDGNEFEHLSFFGDDGTQKFGLRGGDILIEPRSETMIDISKADGEYYFRISNNGKFGFIDSLGNELAADGVKYSFASNFSDDYAAVADDNRKFGYINNKGEEVIAPKYDMAFDFSEGLATVVKNNKTLIIDKCGRETETSFRHVYRFSEGYAVYEQKDDAGNTVLGYVDRNGRVAVPAKFEYASSVQNGEVTVTCGNSLDHISIKKLLSK